MREQPAIVESVTEPAIRHINALELAILKGDEAVDDKLWEQAAEVVKQLEGGMSQRALARLWINGRTGEAYSEAHVRYTVQTCRAKLTSQPRPRFRDAYNEIANPKNVNIILKSSESNEWYTPAEYVEAARSVMGSIDLDPASSVKANETIKANTIFTSSDDGLQHEWHGNVWLNPPYGGASGPFTSKLISEYKSHNVSQAILLVNSNSTDAEWFQPLWDFTLCFTDHRIDFISAGREKSGSTHGSVFIYLGQFRVKFAEVFNEFGTVAEKFKK